MGEDNRRLWAEWVAREVGGDETRQRAALDAALRALTSGSSVEEAGAAARGAVGMAPVPPPLPNVPADVRRCRFCGSVPAVAMTVYEHNGYVILMQFKHLKGPFCRLCGLHAWRRMTDATLLRGWLGVFSFFVAPVTALVNVANYHKLASLPIPNLATAVRRPADPGSGMLRRPGVYVYAVVLAVAFVVFLLPALLRG